MQENCSCDRGNMAVVHPSFHTALAVDSGAAHKVRRQRVDTDLNRRFSLAEDLLIILLIDLVKHSLPRVSRM
jgi:hypothetical protein